MAEAFEAVARAVQAEEEPFVLRREEPGWDAMELGGLCALPGFLDMKVEGEGILDVVVELDGGAAAEPGTFIVVATSRGRKADFAEEEFGAVDVGASDEQVEVRTGAQGGVAIEPLGQPGTFQRDDRDLAALELSQRGLQCRRPQECRDLRAAANLVEAPGELRLRGAGGAEAGSGLGQDVFLFGEVEDGHPICHGDGAGRLSAQQGEQRHHAGSHASGSFAASAASNARAAAGASPR